MCFCASRISFFMGLYMNNLGGIFMKKVFSLGLLIAATMLTVCK